jgi:hypothetical protein
MLTIYGQQIASSILLGSIKVGSGLTIDSATGVLSATGGGGGSTDLSFSFGDSSPANVIVAASGQLIESVKILILTTFDGVGAALEVGDAGQSDRLLSQNQVNPSIAATYESNPNYTYGASTQIELTITPGTGASQGSGLLIITYKS